ncbi:MAG: ATPase [Bacteroidia bacterium]|nr:ATPase [Bacteroidia bacterium]
MPKAPLNILCISSFFKGEAFLRSAKAEGNHVYLITGSKLKNHAWPWESIDETFFMEENEEGKWVMQHLIDGISWQMRRIKFDKLIALDDFDVERAAHIREHFRIPGMGETTAHYFRDKLAMRMKAQEDGIPVPAFTALFHDADIEAYAQNVPGPWMIKPRFAASATGIVKVADKEKLWEEIHRLGGQRHMYLLEKFAPGFVFHVDTLNLDGKVIFSRVSQYLDTPFEVAHGGGIFRSVTVKFGSKDEKELTKLNKQVMKAFGMQYSASHSEFIKGREDGKYYFLETSSRVGGANLAEMVEASSGINLWAEWAKIETSVAGKTDYVLPAVRNDYSGIVVSLTRYQHPDDSSFNDAEICWRMKKDWHIGLIVRASTPERVHELLDKYTRRIAAEFHASLPAPDRPSN